MQRVSVLFQYCIYDNIITYSVRSFHHMGYMGHGNSYGARAQPELHMNLLWPVYPLWCKLPTL